MKHIYVNFKRFDVPVALGGVNRLAPPERWAWDIVMNTAAGLRDYPGAEFTMFFPEAHLLPAAGAARETGSPVGIGCQGVHWQDITPGGNFGAFTTSLPAAAARALGCEAVLIGHCEERRKLLALTGDPDRVDALLNQAAHCATAQGLRVLFCIGETAEQQDTWQAVLAGQLSAGLDGLDKGAVVIAYEPVWAIGPGKTPPDADYIQKIVRFVKQQTGGLDVVYGGGLKAENAAMLAGIPELDGGLIALTRFQGEIGFYPEEYLQIIRIYFGQ